MMTLTVASGPDLDERIGHLFGSFKRLKQRVLWKRHVKGAVRAFELTYSPKYGWHPHFHVLYEGSFIDQAELTDAWKEITGDSCIVDIRLWKGGVESAKRELLKYILKDYEIPLELRPVVTEALKGRRLVIGLGRLYNTEEETPPFECPKCGGTDWFPAWFPVEWAVWDSRLNVPT